MQKTINFEEKAVICAVLLRFTKKRRRKMWVNPLISQRLLKDQFHKLCEDLCTFTKKYIGYFRMSKTSFDELFLSFNSTSHARTQILHSSIFINLSPGFL
jgi:hypothetical protein